MAKQRKNEADLHAKAAESLARKACFEAERIALKALSNARDDQDFLKMAAAVDLLMRSRLERLSAALEIGPVMVLASPFVEGQTIEPGCYLIQPPQVGAEARRLRLAALASEVPVLVLCREPLTQLREVPIVAIGPGSTVRTKVPPPRDAAKPDLDWFAAAMEELGEWAIEAIDESMPVIRRIDALLDALDAIPEHESLHLALKAACQEAHGAELGRIAPERKMSA